ncbi:MAG: hypothetical protein K2M95_03820, partial [Clostridiales bacterium]|nr:hypothetical protein [Clostridiales bacterium]
FTLDPNRPIVVEGKQSVFPFFLFGIACFFVFLLVTLTVTKYRNAFAENDRNYIVIFIAVTVLFCAALGILIGYFIRRANLKKEVLSMRITNGCITSLATEKTRDSEDGHFTNSTRQAAYTRVFIKYAFYDENGTLREEEYTHRYQFSGPYFYEGQELIIAHSREKSYILNKYTILDAPEPEEEAHEDVFELTKSVSAKRLSAYVPIKAAKIYYGYALCYLCGFAILFAFFFTFGIITAKYTHRPLFGQIAHQLLFGSPFLIIFGGLTIYAISIPLIEKSKYKKLLTSPDAKCTHGKIVHADKTYKNDNKMRFYCKFSDGTEKRSVLVPYRSASNLVKSGNTSVLVLFNKTAAVVLVKKGVYPDRFSFGYYRD